MSLGWMLLLQTLRIFQLLIIARVILSYVVPPTSRNPLVEGLRSVTETVLRPIRDVLPRTGGLDLSPLVAILLLNFLSRILASLAVRGGM